MNDKASFGVRTAAFIVLAAVAGLFGNLTAPCVSCIKQACCPQYAGCSNNQPFVALASCLGNGFAGDNTGVTNCNSANPNGVTAINNLVACGNNFCPAECDGGT